MIDIIKLNDSPPYEHFKSEYLKALDLDQEYIDAMLIASYSINNKEVDARYVNLKYINDRDFIFFTNYNSPKSKQFLSHKQITAVIFWSKLNIQIRIKGNVEKVSIDFSDKHFAKRDPKKNALAISSNQSKKIDSYASVLKKYNNVLKDEKNLKKRPKYWGGYALKPTYFEFWSGDNHRINHRKAYNYSNNKWTSNILEP